MLKNKARAFIEEEASVSDVNCSELSSDDEDGSDLDEMDDSFINDDTLLSQSVVNGKGSVVEYLENVFFMCNSLMTTQSSHDSGFL